MKKPEVEEALSDACSALGDAIVDGDRLRNFLVDRAPYEHQAIDALLLAHRHGVVQAFPKDIKAQPDIVEVRATRFASVELAHLMPDFRIWALNTWLSALGTNFKLTISTSDANDISNQRVQVTSLRSPAPSEQCAQVVRPGVQVTSLRSPAPSSDISAPFLFWKVAFFGAGAAGLGLLGQQLDFAITGGIIATVMVCLAIWATLRAIDGKGPSAPRKWQIVITCILWAFSAGELITMRMQGVSVPQASLHGLYEAILLSIVVPIAAEIYCRRAEQGKHQENRFRTYALVTAVLLAGLVANAVVMFIFREQVGFKWDEWLFIPIAAGFLMFSSVRAFLDSL